MNEKRLLWVSRHTMTEDQRADIARIMGVTADNLDIVQVGDSVHDVATLRPLLEQVDAACVVLPTEMLAEFWAMAHDLHRPTYVAKNRRDRDSNGHFVFVHDGWDEVLECVYRCRRA